MYIPSISTRPAPTQSVTDAASCTCPIACQVRRGPSGGPLPRAPPLQRPVQSCDLRADPRLREWTSVQGDGLRRRPAQYMAGRADDAHACDVHLTTLPGALRRASAQGPASEATRTTLHPPGGPPPEEADGAMYILPPSTTHTHTHTHACTHARTHARTHAHTHLVLDANNEVVVAKQLLLNTPHRVFVMQCVCVSCEINSHFLAREIVSKIRAAQQHQQQQQQQQQQ